VQSNWNWLFWQLQIIKKPSNVRKKKRKTSFERKKGLILETITQTESNATKLLVDNLRK
jgi:hypothetical protein